MVVDLLRSCYSTKMGMQSDGTSYNVDWYFVPEGTPILIKRLFHSTNYIHPTVPPGLLGEAGKKTWRDGSIPDYVGVDARPGGAHPVAGLPAWWVTGAPGPGSGGLRWDGSRGYTNQPGPGLFAQFLLAVPPYPSMSSSLGYFLVPLAMGTFPILYSNPLQGPTVYLGDPSAQFDRLFHCNPVFALWGQLGSLSPLHLFRCTSKSASGKITTWVDPSGLVLGAGEVLTLTYP